MSPCPTVLFHEKVPFSSSSYSSTENLAPKEKSQKPSFEENPVASTSIDLDYVALADSYFKIVSTECEFKLQELHLWLKYKYLDQQGDIKI